MVTDALSFPHPVLGLADDIEGNFTLSIDMERNAIERVIEIGVSSIEYNNDYFKKLIENGSAALSIKIHCSSTFKTWTYVNLQDKIKIPEDDVCNKVEIVPSIIALRDIPDYNDSSFNLQFGKQGFYINKYDIIGLLGTVSLPIDKDYERLGLDNIFHFSPESDSITPCSFEFNTDKILIKYPITASGDHPHSALFHKAPWAAYNILIVPALTQAFTLMADKEKESDINDKEWYYVLNGLLPENEREDDPFKNAQLIINRQIPLLKAYEELCNKH